MFLRAAGATKPGKSGNHRVSMKISDIAVTKDSAACPPCCGVSAYVWQATTEKREQNKRVLSKNRSSWLGEWEDLFQTFSWVSVRCRGLLLATRGHQAPSASSARSMPLRGLVARLLEAQILEGRRTESCQNVAAVDDKLLVASS